MELGNNSKNARFAASNLTIFLFCDNSRICTMFGRIISRCHPRCRILTSRATGFQNPSGRVSTTITKPRSIQLSRLSANIPSCLGISAPHQLSRLSVLDPCRFPHQYLDAGVACPVDLAYLKRASCLSGLGVERSIFELLRRTSLDSTFTIIIDTSIYLTFALEIRQFYIVRLFRKYLRDGLPTRFNNTLSQLPPAYIICRCHINYDLSHSSTNKSRS